MGVAVSAVVTSAASVSAQVTTLGWAVTGAAWAAAVGSMTAISATTTAHASLSLATTTTMGAGEPTVSAVGLPILLTEGSHLKSSGSGIDGGIATSVVPIVNWGVVSDVGWASVQASIATDREQHRRGAPEWELYKACSRAVAALGTVWGAEEPRGPTCIRASRTKGRLT